MNLLNGIIYWIDIEILTNVIIYWINAGMLVTKIIYWTRLKWYLVFKWLTGYPFVNVVLQILWRLIIIQWLLDETYWVWDFDLIWKLP